MSSVKLHWRSAAINSTWKNMLQPSDQIYFSESNTSYHNAQNDQFESIKQHKNIDTSWICLVDDDTFVNVPNMKNMLAQMNENDALLIGHVLEPFKCLWGGAGMILSNKAYKLVRNAIHHHKIHELSSNQ